MKYSVLIPVYNVEEYLEECVCSVLRQTFQDYEIVLVNDGSTDASPEVCDRFSKRYPDKVKVIHKKNEGVLLARNEAIRQASGERVIFLDADDCLRMDALMQIHDTFEKHQCDMVIYNYSTSPDFGSARAAVPFADDTCMDAEGKKQLYTLLCDVSYLNGLCFKSMKKELAELLLSREEWRHITNGEDLLCTLPLVTSAERIVYLDQVLYYYRKRPHSAVHTFHPKRLQSIKAVHREFKKYIDLWQMPELHVRHYAKEVKGWVMALELCLENRKRMGKNMCRTVLEEMAEDPYFRNAWEKMNRSCLGNKHLILSDMLYHKRILTIQWLCLWLRAIQSAKKAIKTKTMRGA